MASDHILVVEDDRSLADVLVYQLRLAGFDVALARDGQDGLRQAEITLPDLVVLDLMLPYLDGLEVCRRLRANPATRRVLILMLTAKSEETDQMVGFALGADDYVTKPFSVRVLLERVKALLRRRENKTAGDDVVVSQGIVLDRQRHLATADDQPLDLTVSEFSLLDALICQPGRVFSRPELIDAALGRNVVVLDRTIDVHVAGLRKKMGPHANLVETVRGVGYRFRDPKKGDRTKG
ncbi:MAG: DNA-binding response regulator [Planctomycetes bacterium RBG_16_64_10]|nr:MAG: DNA-binding response regulator [Planctomycetes bacterium RBG_16_64_10]